MQIQIGKIVNTQGIKGEVRILSNSDFKEQRFSPDKTITIKGRKIEETLKIENSYEHKNFIILKFYKYNNINDVEKFKNCNLYADEMDRKNLDDDEYLNSDLLECTVIRKDTGQKLGMVVEIIENPAHNLLRIKNEKQAFLIPFNSTFIDDVHVENKEIIINYMKGLCDED